ncbi:SEC-C metal-binding domain-containing protein [Catenuloplanes sp. NPDC051500]|uniref:SEC-C metal-binding domain-containing protein n=1 Tax=Catenuloplanes sp. NPDC051500 TaxID=3363959 RepID=UPI00379FFA54
MVSARASRRARMDEEAAYYPDPNDILLDMGASLISDGDLDGAYEIYQQVQSAGGGFGVHGTLGLAEIHLVRGEQEQADALLGRMRRDPALDAEHCLSAGEGFELRGDLASAERWLNRGAAMLTDDELAEVDDPDAPFSVAAMLLGSRREVRRQLGREPDLLDERASEYLGTPLERLQYANQMLDDLIEEEHYAGSLSEPKAPPRNAPCPCGSGLKSKKCCARPA